MSQKNLLKKNLKQVFRAISLVAGILIGANANAQQQKTSKTISELSAKLINIQSATNEPFRFSLTLQNATSSRQLYELKAEPPVGWQMSSRVDGSTVTSLSLEAIFYF